MDKSRQHWKILRQVPDELARRVREFMVIGERGEGVLLLTENGEGYWFGEMKFGEESREATEPTRLDVLKLTSMAQGEGHILLLSECGQIYAMGDNDQGQLGLGTDNEEICFLPQLISSPHKFTSVRCGDAHNLALTEDGKVLAWGLNNKSQVGVSQSTRFLPSPRQISELDPHRVVAVECGDSHSLALTDQGEVYAWGRNDWGQLGDGSEESRHTPTRIPTSISIQSITAGDSHTLLLTQSGEVYACGYNGYGQLGLPTATESSASVGIKVAGLPPISQIASHPLTSLSIAMSVDRECFAWGCLDNKLNDTLENLPFTFTPLQLPSIYSTLDSVLSFGSTLCNTPCSVRVEGLRCSQRTDSETQTESLTGPIRLGERASRLFDSPESNPDVKFEFGDHSILAHRCVLQISSAHFNRFFLESSSSECFNPSTSILRSSSLRHTTDPSESNLQITPISPLTTIPIPDHCYPTFHAYLHFLYTGTLQVPTEHLVDLFELAHSHLESDLSELCLVRMRSTLSPENCCLFYQLTERHSLPEFQQDLLHFIADNLLQVFATEAYQSMDGDLTKKLTISIGNLPR